MKTDFKQRIPPPSGGGCIGYEMMSKAVVGENDDKLEARGPRVAVQPENTTGFSQWCPRARFIVVEMTRR